jgi:hypothetical protein
MNEITGDKEFILQLLKDTAKSLTVNQPEAGTASMSKSIRAARDTEKSNNSQIVERLHRAYERAHLQPAAPLSKSAKKGAKTAKPVAAPVATVVEDAWYAPRDQTIALFQAAMDEYLNEKTGSTPLLEAKGIGVKGKAAPKKAKLSKTAAKKFFYKEKAKKSTALVGSKGWVGEKFDKLDPGWAIVVKEKLKLAFKGKHKFISHKSLNDFRYPLGDKVTIALIADWGGGNEHAQAVSREIAKHDPTIVIHLGDVYYAGIESEVRERFLQYWPGSTQRGRSFALNSNHEMYGGGYAYFDITLKQFKQDASYFCLENENWRLIGLDTGYVEHDLNQEQFEWLSAQLSDGSGKKTIIFSHHQPFSAYESSSGEERLQDWLGDFMTAGKITGWYWGHEHLCVVYKRYMGIKGRCIGNGCFPYDLPPDTPPFGGPKVEWISTKSDPKRKNRGIHGFALLTIDGKDMTVSYIDQTGTEEYSEKF